MTQQPTRAGTVGAILRVTSGNFLEQFDFFLFGFYATYIARTFFPAESEFAALMLTFAVFGSGFLMRPIGAVVLGAYIDRIGRRKGLMVTRRSWAAGRYSSPRSRLSDYRRTGADPRVSGPSAAGVLGGRRAWRSVGLSL